MKFIDIPEKKMTVAIEDFCRFEFTHLWKSLMEQMPEESPIDIYLHTDRGGYSMPHTYKTSVICRDGDEYSIKEGRRRAAIKLEKNKLRGVAKRMLKARGQLVKAINIIDKWLKKNCPNEFLELNSDEAEALRK